MSYQTEIKYRSEPYALIHKKLYFVTTKFKSESGAFATVSPPVTHIYALGTSTNLEIFLSIVIEIVSVRKT